MVEKVIVKSSSSDLDGAHFENAATEATLKRLVDLMEKQKPGGGAAVKKAADQAKGIDPKAIKETEDGLSSLSKNSKDASSSVSQMSQSGKDAAKNVDNLSKSGQDASKKTSSFGSTLSFLVSGPLALIGSAFSMITDTIGQSMDALRATGGVGASFNGSLLELNKAAASSGMSLQEYSKFIGQNAQLMANLGGTVTEGAHRMGELSKGLRTGQIGQQMMALGITTDSMNGALADYMKIEAQQGRLQGKTTAELTKGSGEYLKNLGDLSRLTGQSVDELSKQAEAMQRDEKINALMQDMSVEEQKKFTAQMQQLTAVSPELAKAFKDGMIGLGDNDLWNQLSSISPEARQLAEDMKNGRASQEQFNSALSKLGPDIKAKLATMTPAQRAAFEPFLKMGPIMTELNKNSEVYSKEAQERAKREGEASKPFTSAMMNLQSTLSAFWGELKLTFMESGIFKRISEAVDWAATKFTELKDPMIKFVKTILDTALPILDKMGEVLTDVINSIVDFVAPYIPIVGKMLDDIGKALSDTIDDIMEFVRPYIPIVGKLFSDIADTIRANIKPAMEILDTVVNNAGILFREVLMPVIKEVWSDMKDLGTGIFDLGKSIWDSLMPAFGSVSDSFFSFLPSMDDVIQTAKDFKPVIVGVIEGLILLKGIQLALAAAQSVLTILTGTLSGAFAVLTSPITLLLGIAVALGLAFKSLYDSGWTFNSALEAMGDGLKRAGLNIAKSFADMIDYLKGFYGGGRTDEEKKKDKDIYDAEIKALKERADARDVKRAQVRTDRGTEDSILNFSGAGAAGPPTPGSPAAKKQEDALNDAKKKAEEAAIKTAALAAPKAPGTTTAATAKAVDPKEAERQRLIDERTNQILGGSSKPNAAMPNNPTLAAVQGPQPGAEKTAEKESNKKTEEASNATAEAVVATATKADESLKISYQQVATLNTVSDQLNTLNEVMKEILKLHHDQIDTQKDLVNVTKGKYSPI